MAYPIQADDGNWYMFDPNMGLDMSQPVNPDGSRIGPPPPPFTPSGGQWASVAAVPPSGSAEAEVPGSAGYQYDPSTVVLGSDNRWYALGIGGQLVLVPAVTAPNGQAYISDWVNGGLSSTVGATPVVQGANAATTLQKIEAARASQAAGEASGGITNLKSFWDEAGPGILNSIAFIGAVGGGGSALMGGDALAGGVSDVLAADGGMFGLPTATSAGGVSAATVGGGLADLGIDTLSYPNVAAETPSIPGIDEISQIETTVNPQAPDWSTKAPIDPATGLPQVYTPNTLDAIKGGIGNLVNDLPPGVKSLYDMLPSGTIPLLTGALLSKALSKPAGAAAATTGTQAPGTIRPSAYMQHKNPNYVAPTYGANGAFTPASGGSQYLQGYIPGTPYQAAHGGQVPDNGIASLGHYSDGGRLLRGPGTGLSDDIPASIDGQQEARLASGEFVVPADIVSALGGGSTESGSKKLYAMLDRIRQQAHGHKQQIKKVSDKVMPR